ncbi:MAG: 1-(5-phosphoribosyl)-5-[(5-phosphoribosylamino)methylideneamino]imidazole-4-carboxamide isomerase, partial [Spirosoma sp.]|nr:1-(5-phosphoribosyl)-5-[(5-phosphoribosylamino)methylideneamino]imidazole-4-carboxamide isomerase [Spirosoma sp.]
DVAKDGLLQGPSFELYRNLQDRAPNLNIIASGGVSNMQDIETLADMNLYGVIVGKAIYEGRVTLAELMKFSS